MCTVKRQVFYVILFFITLQTIYIYIFCLYAYLYIVYILYIYGEGVC